MEENISDKEERGAWMRQTRQPVKSYLWLRHSSGRLETEDSNLGFREGVKATLSVGRNYSKSTWQILGSGKDKQREKTHYQKYNSDDEGKSPSQMGRDTK